DFHRVRQDPAWLRKAWPGWVYMPWTHRWTIGYSDAAGRWARDAGYNGAFVDGGRDGVPAGGAARLDWIDRFNLRFYLDHAAGKGALHLWDGDAVAPHMDALKGAGVRPVPLNAATRDALRVVVGKNVTAVMRSPNRAAYALDDEPSWGHFVRPTMWRATDDPVAYPAWLRQVYGPAAAPRRDAWVTYDAIRPKLAEWSVAAFDASPLLDQLTFNDAVWCNFVGDLVEHANRVDPDTPAGIVGGQSPNAFGGYDYARLMRKVQFIEAYNIGSAQAVVRSFNPGGAIPAVSTHFHKSVPDTVWQVWYYLAHGNRGHIGWVGDWFDGDKPKPWHPAVAPTYREAGDTIGPLMAGATWRDDGVALYYSHPSIQLGWVLDAEAHGKTWPNRNDDERLGASHRVRKAWENLLRDEGLQYTFVSYVDVIRDGVPPECRVLVLPACLALSDAEARRIRAFCAAGGTVVADYLPGVWDQHGKGRPAGGALDDVFGVRHDPAMTSKDVFGGRLWCEVDQDANYGRTTPERFLTNGNTCVRDPSGFNKAVRAMPVRTTNRYGKGTAVLMNLSPQWYDAYRAAGPGSAAERRAPFVDPIRQAGVRSWVRLVPTADGPPPGALAADAGRPNIREAAGRLHGYEITYFRKGGRTILFACMNPETAVTAAGGGNAVGLRDEVLPVTLTLAADVEGVRDERAGKDLGRGRAFRFDWRTTEAIVLSFAGEPPVGTSNGK
ncbi:MAG: hypothetical protein JWO31_2825, partial [Phycisphaerales bacterium]|nr:hypothetical protein [Phycisphaerales bacterium]